MRTYVLAISIVCIFLNCGVNAYAEKLYTEGEALAYIFPDADAIRKENFRLTGEQVKRLEKQSGLKLGTAPDAGYTFYTGLAGTEIIGYARIDAAEGKHGLIHYIVGITPDGIVGDVAILQLQEVGGRRVKKRTFLDQFIGSFFAEKLRTKKRIQGITGASISTRAVTDGITKTLLLFHECYGKENEHAKLN